MQGKVIMKQPLVHRKRTLDRHAVSYAFIPLFIMVLAAWALPCLAQEVPVFTLEQCVRYGLEHSATARQSLLDEEIARTQVGQAGSLAMPQLTLDAGYRRLDELQKIDLGEGSQSLGTLDNYDVTAGVSQLLYSGGQVGAALRAARLARARAVVERRRTSADLVRDISVQFYGLLLAEERVVVQAASVEQLQSYAVQTEERHRRGAVAEFDLLTAQVRLANEKPRLLAARNEREMAYAAFATLLNYPGDLVVTGRLECAMNLETALAPLQQAALKQRPEVLGSQIRVGLGREAVANAKSEYYPELRAFFTYNGANAYQFVAFEDEWEWHWNAGLTLHWNLWDGDLTRQTVKQRQFEYRQLEIADVSVQDQVLLEVRQAHLALAHARESLAASGDSVSLAGRALEIARTRYESGLSTYIEFTDANLALRTAQLARLQAQHDLAVAAVRVQHACGRLQDEDSNVTFDSVE